MKRKYNYFKILLGTLCAASFLFVAYTLYHHINYKRSVIAAAKANVQSQTDHIVADLDKNFADISTAVRAIADGFNAGARDDQKSANALERLCQSDGRILKSGILFTPPIDEKEALRRSFCFARKESKVRPCPDAVVTQDLQEPWYGRALVSGAGWDEPVFDDAIKYYTTIFTVPLYAPGDKDTIQKKTIGVVYVQLSLQWLKDKMDSLRLEKNDFGLILSPKGTIVYHPISDLVLRQTNVFALLAEAKGKNTNYEKQLQIMQKAARGESGNGYSAARTGQPFWYFYQPIRSAGWSIVVNFIKETVPINGTALRRQQIRAALGLVVFLTTLCALVLRLYDPQVPHHVRRLWLVAILSSVLSFAAACYTWYLALAVPLNEYQRNVTVIDDPLSLNKFVAASSKMERDLYGTAPAYIPTGIYLQSIEFTNSNDISLSGYIWQRYAKGVHDGISRGFIMPEAKTMAQVSEAYRTDTGKEEVIGWYFESTIRQSFDYSKYPFDHPNISLWLRHKDFTKHVLLIPDLAAYPVMNANMLPGLQPRITLPGYSFIGTYFGYVPKMRATNFGITLQKLSARTSEFAYSIIIKRNFITPLVSKFFPVLIVISMLFIVILSFSADPAKQKNFGISGLAVIGLVISFFFSTLLTQIDLRQQFRSDSIIFIENFNFITYLILLLSAIQTFLFAAEKKIKFIQYEHCLIPKLLYWPITTGLILIISLVYFY